MVAQLALGPNQDPNRERVQNNDRAHIQILQDRLPIYPTRQDVRGIPVCVVFTTDLRNVASYRNFDCEFRDFHMKVDLPKFNGHLHIENFLHQLAEVDRFFKYMNILDKKR